MKFAYQFVEKSVRNNISAFWSSKHYYIFYCGHSNLNGTIKLLWGIFYLPM